MIDPKDSIEERSLFQSFHDQKQESIVLINGISDIAEYKEAVLLLANKDSVVIKEGRIPKPTMDEIQKMPNNQYKRLEQLIMDISYRLKRLPISTDKKNQILDSFEDILRQYAKNKSLSLTELKNFAICIVCWYLRFKDQIDSSEHIPVLLFWGIPKKESEWAFLIFLNKICVNIVILNPSKEICEMSKQCTVYEYPEASNIKEFPKAFDPSNTIAFQAEQEFHDMMHENAGVFFDHDYKYPVSMPLKSTYEELTILWNQELKYRPGFHVDGETVTMPIILAKLSGVPSKDTYWKTMSSFIKKSFTFEKPFLRINNAFFIEDTVLLIQNNHLDRKRIKNHPKYYYSYLSESVQERILDCIETLIMGDIIKNIHANGNQYVVLSILLNLSERPMRYLHTFSCTKRNQKCVYWSLTNRSIKYEEAIILAFFSLYGFDVLFLVPTGYRTIETYYQNFEIQEHVIGEPQYEIKQPEEPEILVQNDDKTSKGLLKHWCNFFKNI